VTTHADHRGPELRVWVPAFTPVTRLAGSGGRPTAAGRLESAARCGLLERIGREPGRTRWDWFADPVAAMSSSDRPAALDFNEDNVRQGEPVGLLDDVYTRLAGRKANGGAASSSLDQRGRPTLAAAPGWTGAAAGPG
jgi:hypothetical protein